MGRSRTREPSPARRRRTSMRLNGMQDWAAELSPQAQGGNGHGQAIQITSMLGDSVVSMHRLDGEACGRVRRSTRTLLAASSALVLGGLLAVILSSLGAGAT